jgi:imidazolonepropionase
MTLASAHAPAGLLIEGVRQIATLAGGPRRGSSQSDAGLLTDPSGGLAASVLGSRVHAVGRSEDVISRLREDGVDIARLARLDAGGGLLTPGLIDPHTHLLFSGTREHELELRQSGATYLEILKAGGGILSTVTRTREAADAALLEHGRRWLAEMARHGVTTVEAKSGYGLDAVSELRLLALADQLGREGPLEVVPTFLGAHAVPADLRSRSDGADAYVERIVQEQLPQVAEQGIARFCDVFCEHGVFSAKQSRRVLERAMTLGLRPKLHADELHDSGGAALASQIGAASADHLGAISEAGIKALSAAAERGAAVVATLLPATTLYLGGTMSAPARRLIEHGVPVALGTDFNPGTSPVPNLHLVMSLARVRLGMTAQEALVAATVNAALALGLEETHGTLERGRQADMVLWAVPDVERLSYWVGAGLVRSVVKRGRLVAVRAVESTPVAVDPA